MNDNQTELSAEQMGALLGKDSSAEVITRLTEQMASGDYLHSEELPDEGGLYLIGDGGIDLFIRPVSADGWGQPIFIDSFEPGEGFYSPPCPVGATRSLVYAPVGTAGLFLLKNSDLAANLREETEISEMLTALLVKIQTRLAAALAGAAVRIPENREEKLPELAPPADGSALSENDHPGGEPITITAGTTWYDPEAAAVRIASGRVEVGIPRGEKSFCLRGTGLQATGGVLSLKAADDTTIYPIPPDGFLPEKGGKGGGRPLIIEALTSLRALADPLAAVLDQARKSRFEQYLARSKRGGEETRISIAERLISIQGRRKVMKIIPALSDADAWPAAVRMLARYERRKQSESSRPAPAAATIEGEVSRLADRFGLLSRAVHLGPGDLKGLRYPVIAEQKNGTPLVLEPRGTRIWAHDPLKGSGSIPAEILERQLSGKVFELVPRLNEGPITLRKLFRFAFAHQSNILWRVFWSSVLVALLGMLIPVATKWIFGTAIPSAEINTLNSIGLALLTAAVATALFTMFRSLLLVNLESLTGIRLESALMGHLLRLPLRFFREYRVGDLEMRIQEANRIRSMLGSTFLGSVINSFFAILYLYWMFHYGGSLTWWGILLALVAVVILVSFGLILKNLQRKGLKRTADQQSFLFELIRGILTVRTSGAGVRLYNRWLNFFARQMVISYRENIMSMWSAVIFGAFPMVGVLIIYKFGAVKIIAGELPLSDFIAFTSAFSIFLGAVTGLCGKLIRLVVVKPMWDRAKPLFQAEEERPAGQLDPGELKGEIEINNCSFRYEKGLPEVLQNISLTIRPGEFLALTGPSGAGKSTLISLLLGFEDPDSGTILYDRYDLKDLDPQKIRQQVGVVLQESKLFAGSIRTNLQVNAPLATQDELDTATRSADIYDDIMAMPMRYETIVSEGGATFSGGQVQRMTIARALVPRPKILFFDEATSALDNISQEKVEESIGRLDATRVVVAHRLSTIRRADRIIVIDRGRIVQEGTFDYLANRDGLFKRMIERQQL